jgi:hypothetical protein
MRAPISYVQKNLDVNLGKEWWFVGGSGPNKIFPVKTNTNIGKQINLQD